MGRIGKLALNRIRGWLDYKEVVVDAGLLKEFEMLVERLRRERPRTIPGISLDSPILIFTDGASEGSTHTVGGVLVFPGSNNPRFFGCFVPPKLVGQWFGDVKHIIGPVEAYAILVARKLCWQCINFWRGTGVCIFVTTMALWTLLSDPDFREILLGFEQQECHGIHWPWFSRVPSKSNCADDPSRIGAVTCDSLTGSLRDSCWCPLTGARLVDIGAATIS